MDIWMVLFGIAVIATAGYVVKYPLVIPRSINSRLMPLSKRWKNYVQTIQKAEFENKYIGVSYFNKVTDAISSLAIAESCFQDTHGAISDCLAVLRYKMQCTLNDLEELEEKYKLIPEMYYHRKQGAKSITAKRINLHIEAIDDLLKRAEFLYASMMKRLADIDDEKLREMILIADCECAKIAEHLKNENPATQDTDPQIPAYIQNSQPKNGEVDALTDEEIDLDDL